MILNSSPALSSIAWILPGKLEAHIIRHWENRSFGLLPPQDARGLPETNLPRQPSFRSHHGLGSAGVGPATRESTNVPAGVIDAFCRATGATKEVALSNMERLGVSPDRELVGKSTASLFMYISSTGRHAPLCGTGTLTI